MTYGTPTTGLTSWLGPTRRQPPGGEVLRDVDLFASGTYRGKDYTVADLDQMAANFARLGPKGLKLLDPPGVLGHEETQAYLERTDLPAAGWVRRVRVVKYHEPATGKTEAVLKGDIVGVPPAIANLIRAGRYRKVSAEVYSDFTDDFGNSYGKALRRVAFLGAEVPQVKRIGDLPMPEPGGPHDGFAEPRRTRLRPAACHERGGVLCLFSEVVSMADGTAPTRQDRIQAVLAVMPGLGPATLDGMTDDQLADLAKNLPPVAPAPAPAAPAFDPTFAPGPPGVPPGVTPMGDDLTRDEMIAELAAATGQDPATFQAMPDEQLKEMYAQQAEAGGADMMGDPAAMSREQMIAELTDISGETPETLAQMSDEDLRTLYAEMTTGDAEPAAVAAMSERLFRARTGRPARRPANPLQRLSEQYDRRTLEAARGRHEAQKRQDAELFCDRLTKEGRLFPAHREVFLAGLLAKDDLRPVQKFTENGQTKALTAYEAEKKKLASLPVLLKFGERVGGGPDAGDPAGRKKAEVAKVERFAEQFGDTLRAQGHDPQAMVKLARERADRDRDFTAADIIGRDGVQLIG